MTICSPVSIGYCSLAARAHFSASAQIRTSGIKPIANSTTSKSVSSKLISAPAPRRFSRFCLASSEQSVGGCSSNPKITERYRRKACRASLSGVRYAAEVDHLLDVNHAVTDFLDASKGSVQVSVPLQSPDQPLNS